MSITKITELDQINKSDVTVLKFFAEWCPPCQMYAPIFSDFVAANGKLANYQEINIDEAKDIAIEYNVMSIPTTVFLKDGKVISSKQGVMTPDDIEAEIKLTKAS